MELLKEKAYELGIDALAITDSRPFTDTGQALQDMHDNGLYPQFVEPDIDLRIKPSQLLPGVKSIVSVAIAYKTVEPGPLKPLTGLISRYAWGKDYHGILYARLELLAEFIKAEYGATACYSAVDTRPPVDRAVAWRAGLGRLGKNCSIFVPPYGSWVFLGELLVDVELPSEDSPSTESAGCSEDCGRCVQACPTNALYAPYKINPHICISYLTQMGGMIPLEWRSKIRKRLWGCDTCQQVCPSNRQASTCRHPEFMPIEDTALQLVPLLTMSNREFKERFGSTLMAWRGKRTLQRNAAIILGNYADPETVEPLAQALQDPKEVLRASAAWALGMIGTNKAHQALTKARLYEEHPAVLQEIEMALAGYSLPS